MPTAMIDAPAIGKAQFNVRMPTDLIGKLDAYAALVGQSKAQVAANAIEDYLDWRIPQTENLKLALAAADRGEWATDEEVEAVFNKYGA
jgi:predicted transcriptional regulator